MATTAKTTAKKQASKVDLVELFKANGQPVVEDRRYSIPDAKFGYEKSKQVEWDDFKAWLVNGGEKRINQYKDAGLFTINV